MHVRIAAEIDGVAVVIAIAILVLAFGWCVRNRVDGGDSKGSKCCLMAGLTMAKEMIRR